MEISFIVIVFKKGNRDDWLAVKGSYKKWE